MKAILSLFLVNLMTLQAYSPMIPSSSNSKGISSSVQVEISRRNLLASSATMAAAALLVNPSRAFADDGLIKYEDEEYNKFTMLMPSTWEKSVQSLPDRRKIVLYIKPNSDKKTLVFLAYTPVRGDFTSLGSFGTVDEVAQATILPKGKLMGVEGVEGKMLTSESKKQAYFFDYTQTVPDQPKTHFRTIFSLAPAVAGGAGNILVTITVQTPEEEYASLKPLFDQIMDSYSPK